jgi:hypothetical protein
MNCEEFHFLTLFFGRRMGRFEAVDDESSPVLVQLSGAVVVEWNP